MYLVERMRQIRDNRYEENCIEKGKQQIKLAKIKCIRLKCSFIFGTTTSLKLTREGAYWYFAFVQVGAFSVFTALNPWFNIWAGPIGPINKEKSEGTIDLSEEALYN